VVLNINRLKKTEILWLANHYCKHHHTYLEHPVCFEKEKPETSPIYEKIGFLDIESGGSLTGEFGYVFSYCIKEFGKNKIYKRVIKPEEIKNKHIRDKNVIKQFCNDVRQFDVIVVYYGKDYRNRHDLPFLRTRAVKWGIKNFPLWKEKHVIDVYDIIRNKFKLYKNRMEDACRVFNISCKAHPLNPDVWQDALTGDTKALNYILTHNIEDVLSLEKLYKKVIMYKETRTTT